MIALRLKSILDDIISPIQSAFVPGRLITYNILLAYESIHIIKKIRRKASGAIAQLNWICTSLYDRVEWTFLAE